MPETATAVVAVLANTEVLDDVAHHAVRDVYIWAVTEVARCGAVILPAGPLPAGLVSRFDGVLLTGHASNVDPARYGGPPAPGTADPSRDEAAFQVIKDAVALGIPLLGVCRGHQELNVAYGGTLRSLTPDSQRGGLCHQEDLSKPRDEQYLPAHPVSVVPGGILAGLLESARPSVNSLHSQAIDVLAGPLRAEAIAPDGVIEAASVTGARAMALSVQWHPEWYAATDSVSRPLFEAFGAACRAHARARPDGTAGRGAPARRPYAQAMGEVAR